MILMYAALIFSFVIEIPGYIKSKAWKEAAIYGFLWLSALAGCLWMSLDFKRYFFGEIILNYIEKMFPFVNTF